MSVVGLDEADAAAATVPAAMAADRCVVVDTAAGAGAPLVVTFGFADWKAPPRFDFDGRLRKLAARRCQPFNRILLRDPANAWYQRGIPGLGADLASTAASLRRMVDELRPEMLVTLGQSMGAYAAVLFAHLLGARRAVAFGCLSLLDAGQARAIGDGRWLPVMDALAADPPPGAVLDLATWCAAQPQHPALRLHAGLLPDAATPGAAVNLDLWHARRLCALPQSALTTHADATHDVVTRLRDRGSLDGVLERDLFDPPPALAAGWQLWVAENRLRGCDPVSMQAGMQAAGVEAATAAHALAAIETDPAYLAGCKLRQSHDKLASVMANLARLARTAGGHDHVEKRSRVARDEFLDRYVCGCRPLVLAELAADWPALERWSLADLRARFGHLDVEIQSGRDRNPRYEIDKLAHRRMRRLGDYIDRLAAGGAGNDDYLTANNELLRRAEFAPLLDDIGSLPDWCARERFATHSSFWLGPGGTVTPLHHDTVMLLHTQVVGRKRWRLISPLHTADLYNHRSVFSDVDLEAPDLVRHPRFAGATVLDVVVEQGETLFLPLGWWHHVRALDTSISVSYTNIDVPNDYVFANPEIDGW